MIFRLTEKIWWGDRHSPKEAGESVGAILCLAHNIEDDKYNPLKLPMRPIYVRMAIPDHIAAESWNFRVFDAVQEMATPDRTPILVHCFAGQHRSAATAIYLAVRSEGFTGEAYDRIRTKMFAMCPNVCPLDNVMGRSVNAETRRRCGLPI